MKILTIGNSGFIGAFLTKKLYEEGHEMAGLDKNMPGTKESLSSFVLGNILNPEDIIKAAKGVGLIINLAAEHRDFGIAREDYFKVNAEGTKNVLRCADELGIKKFIFYSTVGVYGDNKDSSTENFPFNPTNTYGESKAAAEKEVLKWAKQDASREVAIIRPAVIFGPRNYANVYNLMNTIYKKRFVFTGKSENIKSIAYVENLVNATIFLLKRLKPGVEVYNYSDYPQMATKDIAKTIAYRLSCRLPRIKLPLWFAVTAAGVFDLLAKVTGYNFPITAYRIKKFNTSTEHSSDKIRAAGYEQKITISEGFRRMAEWYLREGRG